MVNLVNWLNGYIWATPLVVVCLLLGVYFTVRTKFVQLRHIKTMVKLLIGKDGADSEKGFSALQSFAVTVGGRVGIGNIAGVGVALNLGGPGSIFWMGLLALLGSASSFIESSLGQAYKIDLDGEFRGGPAYYIEKGLHMKWYAVLIAAATILGLGICVPGLQTYNAVEAFNNAFGWNRYVIGAIICALVLYSITGGLKRLGRVSEVITLIMTLGYITISLIVVFLNIGKLPEIFGLVFSSAFGSNALFGGVLGSTISWGVKRGIYSNEAGMGSAAIASGSASANHPAEQGLIQAASVFVDTLLVCMLTASMLLFTNSYNVINEATGELIVENLPGIEGGVGYAQAAIEQTLPGLGAALLSVAIFFFAFSSIIAFYHYAESHLLYLLPKGNLNLKTISIWVFRMVFIASTYIGVTNAGEFLWNLADLGIGVMAWLNLIAIFLLQNHGFKILKDYDSLVKAGLPINFDPDRAGLPNVSDVWRKK